MSTPIKSLSSVSAADTYMSAKLHAEAWTTATSDQKQGALNDATGIINRFAYIGTKTDSNQTNEVPRKGMFLNGAEINSEVVPEDFLNAQYEIALALINGADPDKTLSELHVTSRGFANVRTTYSPGNTPEHVLNGVPSAAAWAYLSPYFKRDASGVIRIYRVS